MRKIRESAENYLETILVLQQRNGSVRSIDIAAELEFSKPSVSVAMKNLREKGCITVDGDGIISLTPEGRRIAEGVYERHILFTQCSSPWGWTRRWPPRTPAASSMSSARRASGPSSATWASRNKTRKTRPPFGETRAFFEHRKIRSLEQFCAGPSALEEHEQGDAQGVADHQLADAH